LSDPESVDPKQVAYGCASCGLWVALPASIFKKIIGVKHSAAE